MCLLLALKSFWTLLINNPYVALVGAVAALVAILIDLTRKTNTQAAAQKTLNDIREKAQEDIVEENKRLKHLLLLREMTLIL